ncbi:MAG: triose-phosphate isomerase [Chloroflexi bacterium]|nr:triose-phosphate isomerase [Chloroflexota bacterium]
MRTPIIAANWKMHKTIQDALDFVKEAKDDLNAITGSDKAICAPAVLLAPLKDALAGSNILLGAQNMHWETHGAFTGEISPLMLQGLVDLVIIGHSERRQMFGETDETVNKKIKAALAHDITPIFAFGETLEQNQSGEAAIICSNQVKAGLDGIQVDDAKRVILAYEPIWAIGTGISATPEDANRIIGSVVRATLGELYGEAVAQEMRIQYGGSMKPANVEELMAQPELDGGLVGGASLNPETFIPLVKAAAAARS